MDCNNCEYHLLGQTDGKGCMLDDCVYPDDAKLFDYRVSFWYEEVGNCVVRAKNKEHAEMIVKELMTYSGMEHLKDVNLHDRDYGSQDAERGE